MQQIWLTQDAANPDLIIYMLGWAATPNAVRHISTPGYDVLACCNYTQLQVLPAQDFARYRRIYLFAWSFGIWVAEHCCRELLLYRAIALNGTPFPTHPQWGMRLKAVLRSMRAMAKNGGANPFNDGSAAEPGRYMPAGPYAERSAVQNVAELEFLAAAAEADSAAHLHWHRAYIADKDEIFPPARMWAYWQSVGLGTGFESYHYPFARPGLVQGELAPAGAGESA